MKAIHTLLLAIVIASTMTSCVAPCDPYYARGNGAAIGALTGATAGGIIGNQSDNVLPGAVIGGVLGAVAGSALSGPRYYAPQRSYYAPRSYYGGGCYPAPNYCAPTYCAPSYNYLSVGSCRPMPRCW